MPMWAKRPEVKVAFGFILFILWYELDMASCPKIFSLSHFIAVYESMGG